MSEKEKAYCLVSIELNDSETQSVRELVLPTELDLYTFKLIIDALFGWDDFHLSSFLIGNGLGTVQIGDQNHTDCPYDFSDFTLQKAFDRAGREFRYVYDFGDKHTHFIKLKRKKYNPQLGRYPVYCVKSAGPKGFEDGCSKDDELLCQKHGLKTEDLFDDDGWPKDEYWELREDLNHPIEEINQVLAEYTAYLDLKPAEASPGKQGKKKAKPASEPKIGKYCILSIALDYGGAHSLREITVPTGIKLRLLADILAALFEMDDRLFFSVDPYYYAFFLGRIDDEKAPIVCDPDWDECDYAMNVITLERALALATGPLSFMFHYRSEQVHLIKPENTDYQPEPGQHPIFCLKTEGPNDDHWEYSDIRNVISDELCDLKIEYTKEEKKERERKRAEHLEKRAGSGPSLESLNEKLAKFCYSHRFKPVKAPADGAVKEPGAAKTKAKAKKSAPAEA